jgi:hypothetical protein
MKTFQKWMGILLVAIAAAGLTVACGDTEETTCLSDSDCAAGDLCNFTTGTCAIQCTDNPGNCITGETCAERGAGNEGSICVADDTTDNNTANNNAGECTTSDECTVEGEICVDSQCVPEINTPFFAKIADVSADCDTTSSDPGVDLYQVYLTKNGTNYYAELVGANIPESDTNDNPTPDPILDGNAPDLTGACPESFDGSVVSIGCGGDVVVKFVDETGTAVEIQEGDSITVSEWGDQCPTGTTADQWEVLVCDAEVAEGDLILNTSACAGSSLGKGFGDSSVTVMVPQ